MFRLKYIFTRGTYNKSVSPISGELVTFLRGVYFAKGVVNALDKTTTTTGLCCSGFLFYVMEL
jgi:hypothetical protein